MGAGAMACKAGLWLRPSARPDLCIAHSPRECEHSLRTMCNVCPSNEMPMQAAVPTRGGRAPCERSRPASCRAHVYATLLLGSRAGAWSPVTTPFPFDCSTLREQGPRAPLPDGQHSAIRRAAVRSG